jgi:hypothetical protein
VHFLGNQTQRIRDWPVCVTGREGDDHREWKARGSLGDPWRYQCHRPLMTVWSSRWSISNGKMKRTAKTKKKREKKVESLEPKKMSLRSGFLIWRNRLLERPGLPNSPAWNPYRLFVCFFLIFSGKFLRFRVCEKVREKNLTVRFREGIILWESKKGGYVSYVCMWQKIK